MFFSNLLDAIPIVGHVKGVIHYATGKTEGGNKAMYQATRTSAVLGGGAVGCLTSPGGAVLGAMYAGLATDGVASIAMDELQGIVKGCKNIVEDLHKDKNPTGSILGTGLLLVMDAIGGLGMGGVSSAASQVSEQAVAKTVENLAKKAVSTVGEKAIQNTAKLTGEEVVKMVTKTVTDKTVKKVLQIVAIQAEVALVSIHVAVQVKERTKEEKKKRNDKDNARRDREEKDRQDSERSAKEERDRQDIERSAKEKRDRQDIERTTKEERDRQDIERTTKEERDRQDIERSAKEERDRQDIERTTTEERDRQDIERRAKEERDRQDIERTTKEERDRQDIERSAKEEKDQQDGRHSGSRSGGQPPQANRDNNLSGQVKVNFIVIFNEMLTRLLERVFGKKNADERAKIFNIFQKLSQEQIDYLSKIIERLINCGILEEVTNTVIELFSEHFPQAISFQNFLSLLEFTAAYITVEIGYRIVAFRISETISTQSDSSLPIMESEELYRTILSELTNGQKHVQKLADLFETMRFLIEILTQAPDDIYPMFRDLYSAVYQYYKLRIYGFGYDFVPVIQYLKWIRLLLRELGTRDRYNQQLEQQRTGDVKGTVVCDMCDSRSGRRVRVVVKFQGRTTVLASCFVIETIFENDEDRRVIVNYYS